MVLRRAWGTCNADERYPERLEGGRFIRFLTPKRDLEKCKRWIKACSRPHEQLNTSRINQHKAVCSKQFIGGNGPSKEFPDPISADGSKCTPARKPPKKRSLFPENDLNDAKQPRVLEENTTIVNENNKMREMSTSTSTQTEDHWISAIDMLALSAENAALTMKVQKLEDEIKNLLQELTQEKDREKSGKRVQRFGVKLVLEKEKKLKDLFKYYTGILYLRFCALLTILVDENTELNYNSGRSDIKRLSKEDGLFLTLCRLRHGFGLKDLSTRFGIVTQSSSIVFSAWLELMYLKLGQLNIWPHRDIIISNMPKQYKKYFPTSIIIIDGTEVKTQVPSALALQSQLYSDYKSGTTLKGLIGCDPNGSLMFVSELFTGSISDKAITEQSGFYDTIKSLISIGYIKDGDAIMVDKGFNIHKEIEELGLCLNIPPFAASGRQMSVAETSSTSKIAKHRVHIERLICKVKTFKLLSNCIPTSLFKVVNKIWSVCCFLTLCQDVFVKDKVKP